MNLIIYFLRVPYVSRHAGDNRTHYRNTRNLEFVFEVARRSDLCIRVNLIP